MRRVSTGRVYVPEFHGNRDLPESEQVTVEMTIASLKERDEFNKMVYKKGGKVEQFRKEPLALKRKVERINNYFNDKTDEAIDTPDKLIIDMENGEAWSIDLAVELWNHIMGYDSDSEESEDLEEGED